MAQIMLVCGHDSFRRPHTHRMRKGYSMKVKQLLQKGLIVVALASATSMLSVLPAQAIPYDYTVIGTVVGTFNADFSSLGSSFNSWSLTTPTATFTQSNGLVLTNNLFVLNELVGLNTLSFNIVPLLSGDTYYGGYTGKGTGGVFSGTFTRATSVPEPSSVLLLGIALVGLGVWYRKRIA